jgi:hypothetical protein
VEGNGRLGEVSLTVLEAANSLIWARIERFFVETCFNYFCKRDVGTGQTAVTHSMSCFVEVSINSVGTGLRWGGSRGESGDCPTRAPEDVSSLGNPPSRSEPFLGGRGGQKGPRPDPFPQEQGLHLSALRDLLRPRDGEDARFTFPL